VEAKVLSTPLTTLFPLNVYEAFLFLLEKAKPLACQVLPLSSDTYKVPPAVPPQVVAVTVVVAALWDPGTQVTCVGALVDAADRVILTEPKELDQVDPSPPEATFLLVCREKAWVPAVAGTVTDAEFTVPELIR